MDRRSSRVEGTLSRSGSRQSVSARMKKIAPPPPPPPPLSNGNLKAKERNGGQQGAPPLSSTPGEDCAIDELVQGRMELDVVLPDLKVVKMTVERGTPMMDLLVQATTANKILPGGHIIKVVSKDERNVQYKPNTPIGSLDANIVYIVPKSTLDLPVKRMPKLANQPFEQTFRLQVNLPRNQRMVLRVSPRITLSELKNQICSEKELDHSSHHLVHPSQPDTVLDLNATLEVYGCAEISLMSNSGLRDSIRSTSTNLFAYPKIVEEEKKKKGILRLFSRKKKDLPIETPSNGISLSRSESSSLNRNSYQPKQSLKRKPAPAPPPISRNSSPPLITQSSSSVNSRPESEISGKTDEIESTVSHSRHSSDSSGYHEPSVFSDCSENKSPEASIVHGDHVLSGQDSPLHKDCPDSGVLIKRISMTAKDSTNLKNVPSCSNVSIVSASRKRKAPLPPAPTLPAIESPTSPEAQTIEIDSVPLEDQGKPIEISEINNQKVKENCLPSSNIEDSRIYSDEATSSKSEEAGQKETEALQYLEDVLQESEVSTESVKSFSLQRTMDDSDTDSQKDEEVISVCQAEVHANDNDQDVSKSAENLYALANLDLASPKPCIPDEPNPITELSGNNEVIDNPAEDSGISTSLNSDADSSLPSISSDFKTAFDYECHEELYGNITGLDTQSVPSNEESPIPRNPMTDCIVVNENEILKEKDQENDDDLKSPAALTECNDISTHSSSVETSVELDESEMTLNAIQGNSPSASNDFDSPVDVSLQEQCKEPNQSEKNTILNTDEIIKLELDQNLKKPSDDNNTVKDSTQQSGTKTSATSESSQHVTSMTPQSKRKLTNFALGCYKSETHDIYSIPIQDSEINLSKSNTIQDCAISDKDPDSLVKKSKDFPNVKIVPFEARNVQESMSQNSSRGSVLEKCAQLSNMSTLPLTGRSSSLYNLTPQKKTQMSIPVRKDDSEVEAVCMKRTQSDQNMSQGISSMQQNTEFLQEQKRLQEEYQRLQEEFISWQKQLLNNQSLLLSEQIVPQMPFPSFEDIQSRLESLPSSSQTNERSGNQVMTKHSDYTARELKTRSLPRPKTKQLSLKEPDRPKTPPIPSPVSETSVVGIDIETNELARRPESLNSCSVNTQVTVNQEDKVIQVPSPQEKVTSSTQVPSPDSDVTSHTKVPETCDAKTQKPSPDSDSSSSSNKSQTLPRPKPKPTSALPPSRTMTLNRNTQKKSQVVSVTIGSWQQRGSQTSISDIEPSSVASSRSKFQSLGNIPIVFSKPAPVSNSMENRKLPPVPCSSAETPKESITRKNSETKPGAETGAVPKTVFDNTLVKTKDVTQTIPKQVSNEKVIHVEKASKTIPKQIEVGVQKQKVEIKSSKEATPVYKPGKAVVRLSSMKDERDFSIKGLKKWPLTDINESNEGAKHSIIEDLRASSKRPGGYVQEKIRRAEVDLRKPKPTKVEFTTSPKTKETTNRTEKLHITKVDINGEKTDVDSHIHVHKNVNHIPLKATTPVTVSSSTEKWSNTIPKSKSLNTELMSVFSKKASKDTEHKKIPIVKEETSKANNIHHQPITVNGSTAQPPPPPPLPSTSTMPTIPPAEQIPVSSRLLMAGEAKSHPTNKKESKKSPTKFSRSKDPREELMLEIRGFGGKQALRKIPNAQPGWHLKVFGTASAVNS